MKAKILMRINMFLGAAIVTLLGMSGCERPVVKYGIPEVKYGSPDSTLSLSQLFPKSEICTSRKNILPLHRQTKNSMLCVERLSF